MLAARLSVFGVLSLSLGTHSHTAVQLLALSIPTNTDSGLGPGIHLLLPVSMEPRTRGPHINGVPQDLPFSEWLISQSNIHLCGSMWQASSLLRLRGVLSHGLIPSLFLMVHRPWDSWLLHSHTILIPSSNPVFDHTAFLEPPR